MAESGSAGNVQVPAWIWIGSSSLCFPDSGFEAGLLTAFNWNLANCRENREVSVAMLGTQGILDGTRAIAAQRRRRASEASH